MEIFFASFLAMQGRFERARVLIASSRATRQDIGVGAFETAFELYGSAAVEALAEDLNAAERDIRAAVEHSSEIADRWFYVIASIDLARTVCDQGRPDESLRILDESERHPWFPDLEIVIKRPSTRALALARLGRLEEAESLAREAVAHADGKEFLGFHADALVDLAEVLRLSGRHRGGRNRARRGRSPSTSARATSSPLREPGPCSTRFGEPGERRLRTAATSASDARSVATWTLRLEAPSARPFWSALRTSLLPSSFRLSCFDSLEACSSGPTATWHGTNRPQTRPFRGAGASVSARRRHGVPYPRAARGGRRGPPASDRRSSAASAPGLAPPQRERGRPERPA